MGYLKEYFRIMDSVFHETEYWVLKDINLEMAQCAGSCFKIGSDVAEFKNAKTFEEMVTHQTLTGFIYSERKHEVYVHDYKIGKFPITQEQYMAVTGKNPSVIKGNRLPVTNITYDNAIEFCCILNNKYKDILPEGYVFDLPTEAEWEIACRANEDTSFNNGKNISQDSFGIFQEDKDLNEVGWNLYNSDRKTHEVGQKKPNYWGIYDMHGNVYEWCKDWYGDYPIIDLNKATEDDIPSDPMGPETGTYRVIRGGSFNESPAKCRSSYRDSAMPSFACDYIGFRVALVQREPPSIPETSL